MVWRAKQHDYKNVSKTERSPLVTEISKVENTTLFFFLVHKHQQQQRVRSYVRVETLVCRLYIFINNTLFIFHTFVR